MSQYQSAVRKHFKERKFGDILKSHLKTLTSLCYSPRDFHVGVENHLNITYFIAYTGPIAIKISNMHGKLPTTGDCISNLNIITNGCTGHGNFTGGTIYSDSIEYSVYLRSGYTESEEDHSLEARARGGSRTRTKTKLKTKTKSGVKQKKKPVSGSKSKSKKKTKSTLKTKPKQKSKSRSKSPSKSTPTQKPTTTQDKIKIGPTKNCKQLAILMQTSSKGSKINRSIGESRGNLVGNRVDANTRENISKRAVEDDEDGDWRFPDGEDTMINHAGGTPKKGTACGSFFNALAYPNSKSMVRTMMMRRLSINCFSSLSLTLFAKHSQMTPLIIQLTATTAFARRSISKRP